METIKRIFIILGSLDRRIIFLIVGLSVLIPLLKPDWFRLPIRISPETKTVFNEINRLNEGDKVLMLENTWYSVISPESCSSILWRSWEHKEEAAEALKLTAKDMKKMKLVDEIVKEPLGGAHRDRDKTFSTVKEKIASSYAEFKDLSPKDLVEQRMNKYSEMGVFKG